MEINKAIKTLTTDYFDALAMIKNVLEDNNAAIMSMKAFIEGNNLQEKYDEWAINKKKVN